MANVTAGTSGRLSLSRFSSRLMPNRPFQRDITLPVVQDCVQIVGWARYTLDAPLRPHQFERVRRVRDSNARVFNPLRYLDVRREFLVPKLEKTSQPSTSRDFCPKIGRRRRVGKKLHVIKINTVGMCRCDQTGRMCRKNSQR